MSLPTLSVTLPRWIKWDIALAGNTALDIVKSLALIMHGLSIWLSLKHKAYPLRSKIIKNTEPITKNGKDVTLNHIAV